MSRLLYHTKAHLA